MKKLTLSIALACLFKGGFSFPSASSLHAWLLQMHAAQIQLLKINWGSPGFCTEWDRDYDAKASSCMGRKKLNRTFR